MTQRERTEQKRIFMKNLAGKATRKELLRGLELLRKSNAEARRAAGR